MSLKSFFISWDFAIAIVISFISWLLLPDVVASSFLKDIYAIAITVLSIVFPMFFAALAIIMSFCDNEFIAFLEEDGYFTKLLAQFTFSLSVLFVTLLLSLLLYGYIIINSIAPFFGQLKIQVAIFIAIFFYSLSAVFLAAIDSIKYLNFRIKFIKIRSKK